MSVTYVEEDRVVIGVSVIPVDTIKSLWKLHIANSLAHGWIHQEAHSFSESLAVVDVMIAVQIEEKGSICKNSRNPNQSVHGTSLLVVIEPWAFLS